MLLSQLLTPLSGCDEVTRCDGTARGVPFIGILQKCRNEPVEIGMYRRWCACSDYFVFVHKMFHLRLNNRFWDTRHAECWT